MYLLKKGNIHKTAIDMNKLVALSNKVPKIRAKMMMKVRQTLGGPRLGTLLTSQNRGKVLGRVWNIHDMGPATKTKSKQIIASGDISSNASIKKNPSIPSVTSPKAKEMLNRTMILHEADEVKSMRRRDINTGKDMTQKGIGMHASIDVIMRESNLVRSLPDNKGEVRNFIEPLRKKDGSLGRIQTIMPNFEYGKTRLSRHARKNILKIVEPK